MKITIITAVRNSVSTIRNCIESVASQTYPQIEHIIIDGGSTDGTIDIIKEFISKQSGVSSKKSESSGHLSHQGSNASLFAPHALRVISEPDNGIYDALNKGIRMATGDVIGFLHADDVYAGEGVIERVAEVMNRENVDSCYGDLVYVRNRENVSKGESEQAAGDGPAAKSGLAPHALRFTVVRYWKSCPFSPELLRKGWMPPHPTFFVKREVYETYGAFDTSFKVSADYDLILRFFGKHRITTCYMPEVFLMMRMGGTSNKNLPNILRKSSEDLRAMKMHAIGGITTLLRKNLSKIPQFFKRQF